MKKISETMNNPISLKKALIGASALSLITFSTVSAGAVLGRLNERSKRKSAASLFLANGSSTSHILSEQYHKIQDTEQYSYDGTNFGPANRLVKK